MDGACELCLLRAVGLWLRRLHGRRNLYAAGPAMRVAVQWRTNVQRCTVSAVQGRGKDAHTDMVYTALSPLYPGDAQARILTQLPLRHTPSWVDAAGLHLRSRHASSSPALLLHETAHGSRTHA